ncbi:MAG: 50S ribosomal protein L11 methyltransferase, partial [Candidatus Zipacnadales bacterium]
ARPDDLIIEIDPGGAFGTGTHASTRLALMALERTVTAGDTVIDVGCGSGILSLAALILGAEQVIAVDFDPAAVECTIRNLRNHPVKNRTLVLLADGLSALRARANVIVANLTADAVIRVGERVPTCLEQGGRYIVAGLLEDEVSRVCTGLEDLGLVPQTVDILEGWAAVTLVRRGNSSCVECSSQKKLSKPTESH